MKQNKVKLKRNRYYNNKIREQGSTFLALHYHHMEEKAYSYIIRLLSRRDYSKFKLRNKLQERGFLDLEIDNAIDKAVKKKFLREDYYIESRIKGLYKKGYSAKYIQQKLSGEDIQLDLTDILNIYKENGSSETEELSKIIRKKINLIKNNEPQILKRKLINFLTTKGYNYEIYKELLNKHLEELQ